MNQAKQAARDLKFTALIDRAGEAGMAAGNAVTPTPARFRGMSGEVFVLDEGMCGFAWVNIPGTSSLARWVKANQQAMTDRHGFGVHKGYPRGLDLWCRNFDQSWERKKAWAKAFAEVLKAEGQSARHGDRLD
jgi:hypothetical protein